MSPLPLRVGVMGCGNISDTYFGNAPLFADAFRITACADLNPAAAAEKARQWGIAALTPDALLADPDIDIILNLTIPVAHAGVTVAALDAGKHVYSEKPICLSLDELHRIADRATAKGLQVACAPDTILGAAVQSAKTAIDRGDIGTVVGATAAIMDRGMEDWHPNPDFFFQSGGGPVLDMGPYYLASLIELMGPVTEVQTLSSVGVKDRHVRTGGRSGQRIDIAVPTSVRALLRFASGADAVFMASWDVWQHSLPHIEIYGTEGTLTLPDPNWFGDVPMLSQRGGPARPLDIGAVPWGIPNRMLSDGASVADYRGLGLADLALAIAEGRPCRLGMQTARASTETLLSIVAGGR